MPPGTYTPLPYGENFGLNQPRLSQLQTLEAKVWHQIYIKITCVCVCVCGFSEFSRRFRSDKKKKCDGRNDRRTVDGWRSWRRCLFHRKKRASHVTFATTTTVDPSLDWTLCRRVKSSGAGNEILPGVCVCAREEKAHFSWNSPSAKFAVYILM